MIVVDLDNNVVGSGQEIYRTDVNGEHNLIYVNAYPERQYGFYYIGTADRDSYIIYEDTSVPDMDKQYKFYVLEDGTYEYVEILPEE